MDLCKTTLQADEVVDYKKFDFSQVLPADSFDIVIDCTKEEPNKLAKIAKTKGAILSIVQFPTQNCLLKWVENMGPNPGIEVYKSTKFVVSNLPAPVIELFTGALFFKLKTRSKSLHVNHIITRSDRKELDEILKFVAEKKIKVLVDTVFPFPKVVEAYRKTQQGTAVGKIVIQII